MPIKSPYILATWYNEVCIEEPVLQELLESKAVTRLHNINQYGILDFILRKHNFTRYHHSIHVMTLLRSYNLSLLEQIAGLLHDVSHTAFSHLGDLVFQEKNSNDSYQDEIHAWYLQKTDIPDILQRHNITIEQIIHKNGSFSALEQDPPNLCADRISYTLDGGLIAGLITKEEIQDLLRHLLYKNEIWFFNNQEYAYMLAKISLVLNASIFAAPWNIMLCQHMAQAIKQAFQAQILSRDEMLFSYDDAIWQKLISCNNKQIATHIAQARKLSRGSLLSYPTTQRIHITGKFRCIDPLVATTQGHQRLSAINEQFAYDFNAFKQETAQGWYLPKID